MSRGFCILLAILNRLFLKDDINMNQLLVIVLVLFPFVLAQQVDNSISQQKFVFL